MPYIEFKSGLPECQADRIYTLLSEYRENTFVILATGRQNNLGLAFGDDLDQLGLPQKKR